MSSKAIRNFGESSILHSSSRSFSVRMKISVSILLWGLLHSVSSTQADTIARMGSENVAFFRDYCLECHEAGTQEGQVDLENLPFEIDMIESTLRTFRNSISMLASCLRRGMFFRCTWKSLCVPNAIAKLTPLVTGLKILTRCTII